MDAAGQSRAGQSRAGEISDALAPGSRLVDGRYVIEAVLGQGGFGITYRANEADHARTVAIKEFFPAGCRRSGQQVATGHPSEQAGFEAARGRFVEEARVLARFQHPGIVNVFEVFEENETAYLVMEYLQGETLQQWRLRQPALAEAECAGVVRQLTDALEQVHGAGLLHRDIKPDNVMVVSELGVGAAGPRIVLIDFGTARKFSGDATHRMTATVTPCYAPLEQYGRDARFGPSTDIYALGATVYQLLTGSAPPAAPDRISGMPLRSPRLLNPTVSQPVSDAVAWALEMKVKERPQSVADFWSVFEGKTVSPMVLARQSAAAAPAIQAAAAAAPQPVKRPLFGLTGRAKQGALVAGLCFAMFGVYSIYTNLPAGTLSALAGPPPEPVMHESDLPRLIPKDEPKLKREYNAFIKSLEARLDKKSHANVMQGVASSDPTVQDATLMGLAVSGETEALPFLVKSIDLDHINDPAYAATRERRVGHLARLVASMSGVGWDQKPPSTTDLRPMSWLLLQLLKLERYPLIRSQAVDMIGYIKLREFVPELKRLQFSKDAQVPHSARTALERMGEEPVFKMGQTAPRLVP